MPDSKERMKSKAVTSQEKPKFARLVKGYMGFLTGRGKSLSTISSYKGDLDLFEKFLRATKREFYRLQPRDFDAYQAWLEKQGLKTNTRRRKILSAKALVKYAVSRKKLAPSNILYVKAPERLERLPWIPNAKEFGQVKESVELKTITGLRNWLVVALLAETGMTLAELCGLRWEQWESNSLAIESGRKPRKLKVSATVESRLKEWRQKSSGKHMFPGFNRHGITSDKMTPRGVELFFRRLAKNTGFRALKPKTLRHYAVVEWLKANVADAEIQNRLGVHPNYSLAPYRKVLEREASV
ncbi:MAG TPA: tyrosine-type recombinase/integrase [Bdellovibrionota bacterium]|jgi:integrase/recombinase XerD